MKTVATVLIATLLLAFATGTARGSGCSIENALVRIAFDDKTGALTTLSSKSLSTSSNKVINLAGQNNTHIVNIWDVTLVNSNGLLTIGEQGRGDFSCSDGASKNVLVLTWSNVKAFEATPTKDSNTIGGLATPSAVVDISVTVTLPDGDYISSWNLGFNVKSGVIGIWEVRHGILRDHQSS
jgi:hypothetical protein